jgi:hypothetical protein
LLIADKNMWVGASAPTLSDHAGHLQSVGAEAPTHMICWFMRRCFENAASAETAALHGVTFAFLTFNVEAALTKIEIL